MNCFDEFDWNLGLSNQFDQIGRIFSAEFTNPTKIYFVGNQSCWIQKQLFITTKIALKPSAAPIRQSDTDSFRRSSQSSFSGYLEGIAQLVCKFSRKRDFRGVDLVISKFGDHFLVISPRTMREVHKIELSRKSVWLINSKSPFTFCYHLGFNENIFVGIETILP